MSLGSSENAFGMRWIPTVTHHPTLVVNLLPTPQDAAMDLGGRGAGVRNAAPNLGNDDAGFHDVVTTVGNGSVRTLQRGQ